MKPLIFLVSIMAFISSAKADGFPRPIESALQKVEQSTELKASFSMRLWISNNSPLVYRFNTETENWTLLDGELGELSKKELKDIDKLKEDLSKPGALDYGDLRKEFQVKGLIEEKASHHLYEIELLEDGEDMPDAMREALLVTLRVEKEPTIISHFQMQSKEPFKPAPIAKVQNLNISQQFFIPKGFDRPVLKKFHNKVSGSAMMRNFNEEFTFELFNFVLAE